MSNTTKVIYSTDSQFTNPQNVTESGQPASVTLDNLAANQDYYTKAELRAQDGTLLAESSVSTFKTLQAGVITPTFVSNTKDGNNWVVIYNYTSTYALSSAILTTNSSNFQGVIAGNTVTFTVTGLSDDQTYSTSITFTDIYTETQTVSGSIDTSTGMQPFNIRNIAQSAATVDWNTGSDNRNLQYSEDKSTWANVPYANGKYSVTIPVGKKYYFQGSSTNWGGWWGSDQDVEVSGYVLSLHSPDYSYTGAVNYNSLFNQNNNTQNAGHLHFDFAHFHLPVKNTVARGGFGNMFKKCSTITQLNYDIFYTDDGTIRLDDNCFSEMFRDVPNLARVDGFNLRKFTNLGAWQEFQYMFADCPNLEYVADDFFDTTVTPSTSFFRDGTCRYMFQNCTKLTHPPVLPNVRSLSSCFLYMFAGCTSLTDANKPSVPLLNNGNLGQNSNYSYGSCFRGLFYGCTGITQMDDLSGFTMGASGNSYFCEMYRGTGITSVDASKMPTGTITQNCFNGMFRKTPITSIPSNLLPSTTLADGCYAYMFAECNSLTAVPSGLLPATTLTSECYREMFNSCTNITSVPSNLLPATTMVQHCYLAMFYNCNKLTAAPSLPATTLANNCYRQMFDHCSSLTTPPPSLPSTQLETECYRQMFDSCTSLTAAPSMTVNSVADYSCYAMFTYCRNLSDVSGINLAATTMAKECYRGMFYNQCTSLTTPLSLPATTLADGCYWSMYDGCTNLTGTVALPAKTLVTNCYQTMFNNCNKLQGIEVNFKEWTANCTQNWVNGITNSTGTFTCFDELPQTTGNSNIPANWTISLKYDVRTPEITHDDTDVILVNKTYQGLGTLYYTTDGSTPTSSSTQYTQPFTGVIGQTVKAVCIYQGTSSGVATWVVASEQLPAPTISGTPSTVTITNNDTSGASAIYYTTDGTTPTSASTLYQQPFTVSDGDTVKAVCYNTTGGQLWSDSSVVSKEMRVYTELAYIHNQTMEGSPSISKNIDTGIAMDNTIKFRYKCKYIEYGNGNVNVGNFTSDSNDLRLFFYKGSVYLDWGDSRQQVGYSFNGDFDLTCGNHYCYNNLTSSYLLQSSQANYTLGENCTVDCTSFWLKSLQIWKTIDNVETLVFDGVAAEYNGAYGIWDKVSNTLKTNSTITIVGEIS